jgi:CheY-like chemotaxis protein
MSSVSGVTGSSVLVVEDEKPLRDIYSMILSTAGYDVYTASNGREGIEQVKTHDPDFVLLDIIMPVMNGIDFMKNVNLQEHPKMRVVVFSNNSDTGVKDEVQALGARDVVLKSEMSPSGLVALVSGQLNRLSD